MGHSSTTQSSPPLSSHSGRRFHPVRFWTNVGCGFLLFLFLVFLFATVIPDLCRRVPPPYISGQNTTESEAPDSSPIETEKDGSDPTSWTLPVASSGDPSLLNLDDFPYLSPKIKGLAQAWLDQCAETSQALETIPDPIEREQARVLLKEREKIHAVLALPENWDRKTFESTNRWYFMPREIDTFLREHPEFKKAFEEEATRFWTLSERMTFEFYVHEKNWKLAAKSCAIADRYSSWEHPTYCRWERINSWEEELYCLRQMGAPGLPCLLGRSYQRAFDSGWSSLSPDNKRMVELRNWGYLPLEYRNDYQALWKKSSKKLGD
jgi:hypothetical protein